MKTKSISALWFGASLVVATGTVSPLAVAELPSYQVIDLGTLGGTQSFALGINNNGQVVGHSSPPGNATTQHAFLYSNGEMQDLGTLGGSASYAYAINENAVIVGWANVSNDAYARGFRYFNGTMNDIGTLGGAVSQASDINDSGHFVGWSEVTGNTAYHAFLFDGTQMLDLGTLGGTRSEALGINNNGLIVGRSYTTGDEGVHAFLYDGTTMHDIGTFGGTESIANAVNDAGVAVGAAQTTGDLEFRAFSYDGVTKKDLGTLGALGSEARAINSSDLIVGHSAAPDTNSHGFIYDGTAMRDLQSMINPALGWTIRGADGINDRGQIVGLGCKALFQCDAHALLLTPIAVLFADLLADTTAVGPARKLLKQVTLAQTYYEAQDLQATCSQLAYFNSQVQKLPRNKFAEVKADWSVDCDHRCDWLSVAKRGAARRSGHEVAGGRPFRDSHGPNAGPTLGAYACKTTDSRYIGLRIDAAASLLGLSNVDVCLEA